MKHGFIPFMRAHGQTPGPDQRPAAAGALAGGVAGLVTLSVLQLSGAADSLRLALGLEGWWIPFLYVSGAALAGALYGAVFQRAAGDRRGGWLFGVSYGFLLWMLGPITLLQLVQGRPLATGGGAMGILAAHLGSGLLLGLLFRPAHRVVRKSLEQGTGGRTNKVTRPAVERMYGR